MSNLLKKPTGPTLTSEAPLYCCICVFGIIIFPICYICEKSYNGVCWVGRKSKTSYLKHKNNKNNKINDINNIDNIKV
jgi:hypothetical protein